MHLQDKIQKDFKDTPALWSMCWMNFWCSLYNCAYLFVVTTAGWDLIAFCRECPEVRFLKPHMSYCFPCLSCTTGSPDTGDPFWRCVQSALANATQWTSLMKHD